MAKDEKNEVLTEEYVEEIEKDMEKMKRQKALMEKSMGRKTVQLLYLTY